jgi:phosphate transport system substrate-binding protein
LGYCVPLLFFYSVNNLFKSSQRSHIQIVGSSTVYPFVATISETFGRETKFKTPIVEATGTGGGFKLFCSGIGYGFPDFVNASRKIKDSEKEKCAKNGINVGEIKLGYDGIVLANSVNGQKYNLTKEQIFLALSEKVPNNKKELVNNFYKNWHEIDKNLPNVQIAIYGPPSTSGTRDAFVELVMLDVCVKNPIFIKNYSDEKIRHKKCQIIRSDGVFIEAGENDNLIVQKLKNDKDALGIFGFSFLQENQNSIQSSLINNSIPSLKNIVSGAYKISRPLYIYYKKEHLNLIDGMKEFIAEIVSKNTLGNEGYLLQNGLIPLSNQEIEKIEVGLRKNL